MKKLAILGLAVAASSAFAGVWVEMGDAGDLLPGQMTMGVGSLDEIRGSWLASDADLYCISITDEANFSATTVGGTTADTQLFLFNANGMGVSFNDDAGSSLQSTLTSTFVNSNGIYYLAVTKYDRDANSAGGAIWLDTPFGTERAPDGPGAGGSLSSWSGTTTAGGDYVIRLTGAGYCAVPEPGTMAALGLGALALIRRRRAK